MTQQVLSSAGAIKESNSFGNAGYGTALPSSPTDGMEYVLVDSVSTPSYQWRFRYNAGNSTSYKWELVGGTPALAEVTTDETRTGSTSYADLTTAGPSFTVPRAGSYQISMTASQWITAAAAGNVYIAAKLGSAATSDTDAVIANNTTGAANPVDLGRVITRTLAASDVVKLQYKVSNATIVAHFLYRRMSITPVAVS